MAEKVSLAKSEILAWAIPWDLNTGIVDRLKIAIAQGEHINVELNDCNTLITSGAYYSATKYSIRWPSIYQTTQMAAFRLKEQLYFNW